MDKKYVCPCGLVCCECSFYKPELYETANKLKELIEEQEFDKFLILISGNYKWGVGKLFGMDKTPEGREIFKYFESFKQMPIFLNILDNITKLQCKETCQESGGCSMGGVTHKCDLLQCMETKSVEGCWECSEFEECSKLKLRKGAYGDTIQCNLKIIKEKGTDTVKLRGNRYYAWQGE
jgi:hypothetical protein